MKLNVYLWDNVPLHKHYRVGIYEITNHVISEKMTDDILMVSREHDVYFTCHDIIAAFIDAIMHGDGQAVAVDSSMFLHMEEIDGN